MMTCWTHLARTVPAAGSGSRCLVVRTVSKQLTPAVRCSPATTVLQQRTRALTTCQVFKTDMTQTFTGYERRPDSGPGPGGGGGDGKGNSPGPAASPAQAVAMGLAGAAATWALMDYLDKKYGARARFQEPFLPADAAEAASEYALPEAPPEFPPAAQIRRPGGQLGGNKFTLYQYRTCPFCCKVRAMLDYYGVSYDVIEVNSVSRKQIKWSTYRKVPMLVAEKPDGSFVRIGDSVVIVSALRSLMEDPKQDLLTLLSESYPKGVIRDEKGKDQVINVNKYNIMYKAMPEGVDNDDIQEERKWRKWADHQLVHKISPNVYRSLGEALETFRWFDEVAEWEKHFKPWERQMVIYVGALAMWLIAKRLKKKHNLKEDVRESLYDDANHLVRALRHKRTPFLGGQAPNLADLAVFGCLGSFEGCRAFQDLLDNTKIAPWFFRMKEAVANSRGSGTKASTSEAK